MPPAAIQDALVPGSAGHQTFRALLKKVKVVAHYGIVPLVLYLGFQSGTLADPSVEPSFISLFVPVV